MTRYATKSILAAAVCAAMAAASVGTALAYGDDLDPCRKWTGEGAGEQYKCFDCMKNIGGRWVNTCGGGYYGYAPPPPPPGRW
jgi:hypothetical protein